MLAVMRSAGAALALAMIVVLAGCSSRRVALEDGRAADLSQALPEAAVPHREASLPDLASPDRWLKRLGGKRTDFGAALAVDAAGNVYVAGGLSAGADLGGGVLAASDEGSLFVASFAPDGAHRWSKVFGAWASSQKWPQLSLAIDPAGDLYLGGVLGAGRALDFGGGTIEGGNTGSMFIASLGSGGDHRWSRSLAATQGIWSYDVIPDGLGRVVFAGRFNGFIDLGEGTIFGGGRPFLLSVKSTDGTYSWSKSPEPGPAFTGLAADASGNLTVSGKSSSPTDLGPVTFPPGPFIASFTADGAYRWAKFQGDAEGKSLGTQRVASEGNDLYLLGTMGGPIDYGGGPLNLAAFALVGASLTADGGYRWAKVLGSLAHDRGIVLGGGGDLFIFGDISASGSDELGGTSLTANGESDGVLARYSSTGELHWVKQLGGPKDDSVLAVAPGPGGSLYVTGYFSQTASLIVGSLTSVGDTDGFLLRMVPQ